MFDGEKKPRRQNAWDRDNMRTVSTRMREGEALYLLALCKMEGITRYALVQNLLRDWMDNWSGNALPDQPQR